ncbi:hypothetical protein K469DRAFT_14575 [Zopfia rhizophila CBS 207.26]|uniref:Uncharacterized protein n=1 Tax=Zopfia rhizophila CBS 207.26 TaxID=1314779 RepID=A0A6A6EWG2_9PEZI|nr:hypothetical protein K469DRAFT_14575 [Zopfia rhizophila CBS 207.26]
MATRDRSAFTLYPRILMARGVHAGNSSMQSAHQFETAFETKPPRVDPFRDAQWSPIKAQQATQTPNFCHHPSTPHLSPDLLARSRLRPHRTWSGSEVCRRLKTRPTSLHRDDYNPSIKPGAHHCASTPSRKYPLRIASAFLYHL